MHLAELEKSLGKQIRVVISDGRVIEGEFQVHLLGCLSIQLRSRVCKLIVSRQLNLKYLTFHLAVLWQRSKLHSRIGNWISWDQQRYFLNLAVSLCHLRELTLTTIAWLYQTPISRSLHSFIASDRTTRSGNSWVSNFSNARNDHGSWKSRD